MQFIEFITQLIEVMRHNLVTYTQPAMLNESYPMQIVWVVGVHWDLGEWL